MSRREALRAVAAGCAGALLAITLLSPFRYAVGPFTVTLAVTAPAPGGTRLEVPPAGELEAATHPVPVRLTVRLERVDVDGLELLAEAARGDVARALVREAQRAAGYVAARTLALGLVGGTVLPALLGVRARPAVLLGAACGLGTAAALAGLTAATYDLGAFARPRFTGALEGAPWLIGAVEESLARWPQVEARLQALAAHLLLLFQRLDALPPLAAPPAELTVLVVADVHNNPVGVELILRAAALFGADLVLDAGDLTDYGTALEGRLLQRLAELEVPYVLVPGNHDGPTALARLEQVPNVVVLRQGVVRVGPLRIAGLADPSSASTDPREPTPAEVAAAQAALERALAGTTADVLVVHHPEIGRPFFGRVPLLVTGHTHRQRVRVHGGAVWIDPGSTGAAGIRGLQAGGAIPYGLALAHLGRDAAGWRVVAVDTVRVEAAELGYRVERRLVAPGP